VITAVVPPSTSPGVVDTSVTTAAGTTTASAADQFTYTANTAFTTYTILQCR